MSSPNNIADARFGARPVLRAMHQRRHFARERALRVGASRALARSPPRVAAIGACVEKREQLQITAPTSRSSAFSQNW